MAVQVVVAPPARQTRLGGLRSVATWVTNARIGAAESVAYLSDGCTMPQPAIGLCYGEAVVTEKEGVGLDTYEAIGEPFALYGGVACFIGPDTDFPERARRVLIQGEDRVIEDRLATWANGGTALAAGATVVEAIANVEQNADANYLGRPVILMSRADALIAGAAGALEPGLDGVPTTTNGTPVVASGLIETGTVYGVGAVAVLRSETSDIDTIDHTLNTEWAVAEAVYALLVDCNYRVKAAVTA